MATDPVPKYLANYAEADVQLLANFPEKFYQRSLIIPAFQEDTSFIDPYLNGQFASLLLILVINQPEKVTDDSHQISLYRHIVDNSRLLWEEKHLSLHQCADPTTNILCIRRYETGLRLRNNQGVGEARKIAADCALELIHNMRINSHWIASTDADARLPDDYFNKLEQYSDCSALTFNYQHEVNQGPVSRATQVYEQSLRYYQAGLAWAGSPYAFHSLGSCLAVNAFDYARVRGFPKRSGGEDFYLLNKLSKIGAITHCNDVTIHIDSRTSDRVPFGTGPAIRKILQLDDPQQYRYYHPQVFVELRSCLDGLKRLQPTDAINNWKEFFSESHFNWLNEQGLKRIFIHMQHQKLEQPALEKDLLAWFDGLMTLRFINYIRDELYPDCMLNESIKKVSFYPK